MSDIATAALPFFGLVFLGYAVGRWGPVRRDLFAGFEFFVRSIALPALYFQLLATAPIAEVASWSFILTTAFGTYCAFAIAFSFAALINRGHVPEATVEGLAGSQAAATWLAPGLTLAALGAGAGVPTALMVAFDSLMLAILTPLMMALAATDRTTLRRTAEAIGWDLLREPVIIGAALGFLWSATGIGLPGPLGGFFGLLSAAAVPAALILFGLTLFDRKVDRPPADVGVLIVIKLVVHPLIVWLLLSWIGGFPPVWVAAAVLVAALPPGVEVLAAAARYRSYGARASQAMLWGSAASVVTLLVTLVVVLGGLLPADPFR